MGQVLKPGTVVQTDMNKDSFVDLVLGEESAVVPVVYNPSGPTPAVGYAPLTAGGPVKPATSQNVVRVWENTVLGVDKLTSLQTGADVVTETQLDLKAGHITAVVKKMSAASRYEVKIPDGVAGIRGTIADVWANGNCSASEGSVVLVRTKKPSSDTGVTAPGTTGETTSTTVINSGQTFDCVTGLVRPMTPPEIKVFYDSSPPPVTSGAPTFSSAPDIGYVRSISRTHPPHPPHPPHPSSAE
jgi:hypothetical protein